MVGGEWEIVIIGTSCCTPMALRTVRCPAMGREIGLDRREVIAHLVVHGGNMVEIVQVVRHQAKESREDDMGLEIRRHSSWIQLIRLIRLIRPRGSIWDLMKHRGDYQRLKVIYILWCEGASENTLEEGVRARPKAEEENDI